MPLIEDKHRLNSDEIPPESHQIEVQRVAKEYLHCLDNRDKQGLESMDAQFEQDPLFGLEVFDEALVLCKNASRPIIYRVPIFRLILLISKKWRVIPKKWSTYYNRVVQLRGGRERRTTTPTLRGGGRRKSPD